MPKPAFPPGHVTAFETHVTKGHYRALQNSKHSERYAEAVEAGYVPPVEMLQAIMDLDADAFPALSGLKDRLQEALGPTLSAPLPGEAVIDENTTAVATLQATDPQGDALTYTLIGADKGLFEFDPATGELRFTDAPNYEVFGDANKDNVYEVGVQVSDGVFTTETLTTIKVDDLNESPSFSTPLPENVTVKENTAAVATIVATDPENDTLFYELTGADADHFVFNPDTRELNFRDAPDYETRLDENKDNVYEVGVQVSDGVFTTETLTTVSVVDVNEEPFGFALKGVGFGDRAGTSVASAGDVNGDGIDDILIGAYRASPNDRPYAGETYVVFGRKDGFAPTVELASIAAGDGTTGFVLSGAESYDYSGVSVASAGDVNGDGVDDILIGASYATRDGKSGVGESYLIFGRKDGFGAKIDLASLAGGNGATGFVLNGVDSGDLSGSSVASAGDVNGDGIDDILIGASRADVNRKGDAGETYVVFGSKDGFAPKVELASLADGDGTTGFVLNGIDSGDGAGNSVASAGDVNGDGIDDILIGALGGDPNSKGQAGETYVVFGSKDGFGPKIELASIAYGDGANGFVLNGVDRGDISGASVASAGDVNGDGIDDILIGATLAEQYSGESYVVFGRDDGFGARVELASIAHGDGANGFVLNGINPYDQSGISVASAGDVNGDGVDDILIGASYATQDGKWGAGESYLVFGRKDGFGAKIDLASLAGGNGTTGFVLKGIDGNDFAGDPVASAGDVNGDGVDDILIGASGIGGGKSGPGGGFVIFGGEDLLHRYDAADGHADGSLDLALLGQNPAELDLMM